jgi:hypothetical protein
MRCRKTEAVYVTFVGSGLSMPEIARVGFACNVIGWNAVRVTRTTLDKQPHDLATMFDPVAEWRNLTGGIVALHCAIRSA